MVEVERTQEAEFIKAWDTEEKALGNVKVIVADLEAFEYTFAKKEDMGRYYIICDDKIVYKSIWYEIPR